MSNVQWNVSDEEDPVEELSDDELPTDPPGYVPSAPEEDNPELDMLAVAGELYQEEQDDQTILSNARMRPEQGRLYEMLMTTDIFANLDADDQAIKNVQREIKRFAKERMEVMLGMRKPSEQAGVIATQSPFNALEIQVLKTLATRLSGGDTQKVNTPQPPKASGLTPISSGASKLKATVKSIAEKNAVSKPSPKAPRAPATPEKPKIDPDLANKKIEDMSYDEKLKYNTQKSAIYKSTQVASPEAIPMPSVESLNSIYGGRALTIKQVEANFKK